MGVLCDTDEIDVKYEEDNTLIKLKTDKDNTSRRLGIDILNV